MKPAAFLTKFEAAVYLHELYQAAIDTHDLPDERPNFYSLINENRRNPASPDAIRRGIPRGNRGYYSTIPTVRLGKQVYFIPSKLDEWFEFHFLPKMLEAA
jgi:hypothetical protein